VDADAPPRRRGLSIHPAPSAAQPQKWTIDTAEARARLFRLAGVDDGNREFALALDEYLAGVLIGRANQYEDMGMNATGLTGPAWYGEGFRDAMRHIEETGLYLDPS
jgi:hypothetical protein